jgi:hypothetical protein
MTSGDAHQIANYCSVPNQTERGFQPDFKVRDLFSSVPFLLGEGAAYRQMGGG